MSLISYKDARPWAKSIRQRVATRQMPPWHIDKTVGVQHFKNDMSLSDEQTRVGHEVLAEHDCARQEPGMTVDSEAIFAVAAYAVFFLAAFALPETRGRVLHAEGS